MKLKFKVGDYICSDGQRYIVISINKDKGFYGCVDAFCGREGYTAILFQEHLGWASEKDFEKHIPFENEYYRPCVMDEYCDEFNFPNEWRYSNRK